MTIPSTLIEWMFLLLGLLMTRMAWALPTGSLTGEDHSSPSSLPLPPPSQPAPSAFASLFSASRWDHQLGSPTPPTTRSDHQRWRPQRSVTFGEASTLTRGPESKEQRVAENGMNVWDAPPGRQMKRAVSMESESPFARLKPGFKSSRQSNSKDSYAQFFSLLERVKASFKPPAEGDHETDTRPKWFYSCLALSRSAPSTFLQGSEQVRRVLCFNLEHCLKLAQTLTVSTQKEDNDALSSPYETLSPSYSKSRHSLPLLEWIDSQSGLVSADPNEGPERAFPAKPVEDPEDLLLMMLLDDDPRFSDAIMSSAEMDTGAYANRDDETSPLYDNPIYPSSSPPSPPQQQPGRKIVSGGVSGLFAPVSSRRRGHEQGSHPTISPQEQQRRNNEILSRIFTRSPSFQYFDIPERSKSASDRHFPYSPISAPFPPVTVIDHNLPHRRSDGYNSNINNNKGSWSSEPSSSSGIYWNMGGSNAQPSGTVVQSASSAVGDAGGPSSALDDALFSAERYHSAKWRRRAVDTGVAVDRSTHASGLLDRLTLVEEEALGGGSQRRRDTQGSTALYQASGSQVSCQLVNKNPSKVTKSTIPTFIPDGSTTSSLPFNLSAGHPVCLLTSHHILLAVLTKVSLVLYSISDMNYTPIWAIKNDHITSIDPQDVTCLEFKSKDELLIGCKNPNALYMYSTTQSPLTSLDGNIGHPTCVWQVTIDNRTTTFPKCIQFSPNKSAFLIMFAGNFTPRDFTDSDSTCVDVWCAQDREQSSRHTLPCRYSLSATLFHPNTVIHASWDPSSNMICTVCADGVSRFWLKRLEFAFVAAINPNDVFNRVDAGNVDKLRGIQPLHWIPLDLREIIAALTPQERSMYGLHEFDYLLFTVSESGAIIIYGITQFTGVSPFQVVLLKTLMKMDRMLASSRRVMMCYVSDSKSGSVVDVFVESANSERHSATLHSLDLLDFLQVTKCPRLSLLFKWKPITEPISKVLASRTGPFIACFAPSSILFQSIEFTNITYHSTVDVEFSTSNECKLLSGIWMGRTDIFAAWSTSNMLLYSVDSQSGKFVLKNTIPIPPTIHSQDSVNARFHVEYMCGGPNMHVLAIVGSASIALWQIVASDCSVKYSTITVMQHLLPDWNTWQSEANGSMSISGSVPLVEGWEGPMDRMLCLLIGNRVVFLRMDISYTWEVMSELMLNSILSFGDGQNAVAHIRTNPFGSLALGTNAGDIFVCPFGFYKHNLATHPRKPITPRFKRSMGSQILSMEWDYTLVFGSVLGVLTSGSDGLVLLNESLDSCFRVASLTSWSSELSLGQSVSWSWARQGIVVRSLETSIDAISLCIHESARSVLSRKLPQLHPLNILISMIRNPNDLDAVRRIVVSNFMYSKSMAEHGSKVIEFPLQIEGQCNPSASFMGDEDMSPTGELSGIDDFMLELENTNDPTSMSDDEVDCFLSHPAFSSYKMEFALILKFLFRDRDAALDDKAFVFTLLYNVYQPLNSKSETDSSISQIPDCAYYWAYQSETFDAILSCLFPDKQLVVWTVFRSSGAGLWIKSLDSLKSYVEIIARAEYIKTGDEGSKHPVHATLFYAMLRKRPVLLGLWKLANHPEQTAMVKFLSSDFNKPEVCAQALKNAFVLLSKQRYMYAAAFFLLGGSLKDCLNVILQHIKDVQLAWVVSRVFTNDSTEHVSWAKEYLVPHASGASLLVLAGHLNIDISRSVFEADLVVQDSALNGFNCTNTLLSSSTLKVLLYEAVSTQNRDHSKLEYMVHLYRQIGLPLVALECLESLPPVPECCESSAQPSQERGSLVKVVPLTNLDWGQPAQKDTMSLDWGEPVTAQAKWSENRGFDWGEPVTARNQFDSPSEVTGQLLSLSSTAEWGIPVSGTVNFLDSTSTNIPSTQASLSDDIALVAQKWDLFSCTFSELMYTLTIYQKHPFLIKNMPDVALYFETYSRRVAIPLKMVYRLFSIACAENHGILAYTVVIPPESGIIPWKASFDDLVQQECNFLAGCLMSALQEGRLIIQASIQAHAPSSDVGPAMRNSKSLQSWFNTLFRHSKRLIMGLILCKSKIMLTNPTRQEESIYYFVVFVHLVACIMRARYDIVMLLLEYAYNDNLYSLFVDRFILSERYLDPDSVASFTSDELDHDEDGNSLEMPNPDAISKAYIVLNFMIIQFFLRETIFGGISGVGRSKSNEWLDRVMSAVGHLAYPGFRRSWLVEVDQEPAKFRRKLPVFFAKAIFEFLRKHEQSDATNLSNKNAIIFAQHHDDEPVSPNEDDFDEGVIYVSKTSLSGFVIDPLNSNQIAIGCSKWVKEMEARCHRPLIQFPLNQEDMSASLDSKRHNVAMEKMEALISKNVKHFNLKREVSDESISSSIDSFNDVGLGLIRTASVSSTMSRNRGGSEAGSLASASLGSGGATVMAPLPGTHSYLIGSSSNGVVDLLAFGNPNSVTSITTPLSQVMILKANMASARFMCAESKGSGYIHLFSLHGIATQSISLNAGSPAGNMNAQSGSLAGFSGGIYDAIFTSPSLLAVCGLSPTHTNIALYDTLVPSPMARVLTFNCLETGATCLVSDPLGMRPFELIGGGKRGDICVLDTRMTKSAVSTFSAHEGAVKDLVIDSATGTLYSASKVIKAWTRENSSLTSTDAGSPFTSGKFYYPCDPYNYVYQLSIDDGYMTYLNATHVVRMRL